MKYRHKKAYLLEFGALLPVAVLPPSVRTFPNLRLMDSPISHIYQHQKTSHKHAVPEQVQFLLDSHQVEMDSADWDSVLFHLSPLKPQDQRRLRVRLRVHHQTLVKLVICPD